MTTTLGEIQKAVINNLQLNGNEAPPDRVIGWINSAIRMGNSMNLVSPVNDETLSVLDDTYEYSLNDSDSVLDNIAYIYNIFPETDTDGLFSYEPIPWLHWEVSQGSPAFLLFHRGMWAPNVGFGLRITGGLRQPQVAEADDVIYLPPAYIEWEATMLGHMGLSSGASPARQSWHTQQIGVSNQLAEDVRLQAHAYKLPPLHRKVPGRF